MNQTTTIRIYFPMENFDYLGTNRSQFINFNQRRTDKVLIFITVRYVGKYLFPVEIDNMQVKNFNKRDSMNDIPLDIFIELEPLNSQPEEWLYFMINCQAIN